MDDALRFEGALVLVRQDARLTDLVHVLVPVVAPEGDHVEMGRFSAHETPLAKGKHVILDEALLDERLEQHVKDHLLLDVLEERGI